MRRASSPGTPVTPAKAGATTAPRALNVPERLRVYLATGASALTIDRDFAIALLNHTRSNEEIRRIGRVAGEAAVDKTLAETRDRVAAALFSSNLARCEAELRADRAEGGILGRARFVWTAAIGLVVYAYAHALVDLVRGFMSP